MNMTKLKAILLVMMLTACSKTVLLDTVTRKVTSSATGTVQYQYKGKVVTKETNMYVGDEKINKGYTVRVRGGKVVEIISKGKGK